MFYFNQFNTFADSVDKMVPTDRCSQTELQFVLPGSNLAKAEYVQDYTADGPACGTVMIYWDYDGTDFANKTEVDSLQYAIDAVEGLIRMYGGNTDKPTVTEAIESLSPSLTEESVVEMLGELNLNVENKWFDGNKSRIVFDVKSHDGETICVWVEPPYEAKLWFKDRSNRNNGLIEDITNISTLKEELYAMVNEPDPEISLGNSIDTAMMDHYDMMNGDIGDIDIGDFESISDADRLAIFEESVSKMCKAAGQEALTESVIELARTCLTEGQVWDKFKNTAKKYGTIGLASAALAGTALGSMAKQDQMNQDVIKHKNHQIACGYQQDNNITADSSVFSGEALQQYVNYADNLRNQLWDSYNNKTDKQHVTAGDIASKLSKVIKQIESGDQSNSTITALTRVVSQGETFLMSRGGTCLDKRSNDVFAQK